MDLADRLPVYAARVNLKIITPATKFTMTDKLHAFASNRDARRYVALMLQCEALAFDPDLSAGSRQEQGNAVLTEIKALRAAGAAFEATCTPAQRRRANEVALKDAMRLLRDL